MSRDNNIANGFLVISLDFELLWGVFDVVNFHEKLEYFENTRRVIPLILDEFSKAKIHATWATVGMLFNEDWDEWEQHIPQFLPEYHNKNLSAYLFGKKIKAKSTENLCFAPDIIRKISVVPGQEIGTHTYSHYYCLEQGQNLKAFEDDLKLANKLAEKFEIQYSSLVFPRNQIKEDYLKICLNQGITNVRSNPDSWYWKNTRSEALLTKLARTGDAYLPLGKKTYSRSGVKTVYKNLQAQRASRFLRPVENSQVLRNLKIKRIKGEMEKAAKNNEIYHLWWHPHNFGDDPAQSITDLKGILDYYKMLNNKFNFQSLNMRELGVYTS